MLVWRQGPREPDLTNRRDDAVRWNHMKLFARTFLLYPAFVAPWTHAAAPDPSLVGCWQAVKIVQYAQDGSKIEDSSGRCTLQFKEDQLESTCKTSSGTVTSSYRYRVIRPNFYSAT